METLVFIIFAKNSVLNLWEGSEYVSCFKYVRVLNIFKFSLVWQGCEYVSEWNYGRVLNIPGFRVCQVSAYAASVTQASEYVWIWLDNVLRQNSDHSWWMFHRVLNKPAVLNMAQNSEHGKVVNIRVT